MCGIIIVGIYEVRLVVAGEDGAWYIRSRNSVLGYVES